MPVYEYHCPDCDADFEELVHAAARDHELVCPSCQGRRAARQLSVFAARAGVPVETSPRAPGGACMRCGDANGPCGS